MSEIKVNSVVNSTGDNDSGLDLATNDQVKVKIANAEDFIFKANSLEVQTGSNIDMNGTELILDADGDTSITADTDDQIDFKTGGSDRVTINSSGSVMIGTSSSPNNAPLLIHCGTDDNIRINQETHATISAVNDSASAFASLKLEGNFLLLNSQSGANVLINTTTTSVGNDGVRILPGGSGSGTFSEFMNDGGGVALSVGRGGSDGICTQFRRGSGVVGSISVSSSSTAFNTSSDYRLKENVVTEWDGTSRLKQLKPSRFNFKTDKDTIVDGFLAHEVSSIVPEAITGAKDETQDLGTIKDKDGNVISENVLETQTKKDDGETWTKTKTEDVYQGIDQSKLVPLLVKTIQELEARITALESK